jgi:hypothetical protein
MGGLWPLSHADRGGDDGRGNGGLQSDRPLWPGQIEEGLIGECEAEHQNLPFGGYMSPAPAALGRI